MDKRVYHWPSLVYGPMIILSSILLFIGWADNGFDKLIIFSGTPLAKAVIAFVIVWPHLLALLFLMDGIGQLSKAFKILGLVGITCFMLVIANDSRLPVFYRVFTLSGSGLLIVLFTLRHGKVFNFAKIIKEKEIDMTKKIFVPGQDILELLFFSLVSWLLYSSIIRAAGLNSILYRISPSTDSPFLVIDMLVCAFTLYIATLRLISFQIILAPVSKPKEGK